MSGSSESDRLTTVLRGADNASPQVRELAERVVQLADQPVHADLLSSGGLADSLVGLARMKHVIDAEIARRVHAAEAADVLTKTARTTLQSDCQWAGSAADAMVTAAKFVRDHPQLLDLWQRGQVSVEAIAALARGSRGLPDDDVARLIDALVPSLPRLSLRFLKIAIHRAVDLLMPHDRDAREQRLHDRRYLVFADLNGVTTLQGQMPSVDGAALQAALSALAESLRAEGDGLTRGQRQVDALVTLVNRAAAHGDLPASASGLPVATTVTVGVSEADRIARGGKREAVDLTDLVATSQSPGSLAGSASTTATLGDAATRFALCHGTVTGILVDDRGSARGPISEALATTATVPLAVGRETRLATRAQRIALALRDRGCVLCERPPGECQAHHVTAWDEGGGTDLENLALLCWVHHRQVDLNRWLLTRTPDPTPGDPYWTVTPTPRHAWRQRPA